MIVLANNTGDVKPVDNYHTLQSLIALTDLTDTIEISPANNFQFTTAEKIIANDDNLIVKAAKTLSEMTGKELNIAIHLTKNIPIGAGLGGASTDAATTIKGLIKYWDIEEPQNIQHLLSSLGADVPACYQEKSCYVEGYGEIIHQIKNIPSCHALIVYPNIFCSTANIFKNYPADYSQKIDLPSSFATQQDLYTFLKTQQNDLTESARSLHPEISDALKIILKQEDCDIARMSGSGSSCFGLFENKEQSISAAEKIQKERPDWFVRPIILH